MTYDEYRAVGRFQALQVLRTLCVVATITWHLRDPLWAPLRGYLGVSVFFVISGYLITTLLLREEESSGSFSLVGFYVRRAFRLLPMYYLVLLAFVVAVLVLGWHAEERPAFEQALPYYLTYQQEFAPKAPFGHAWSLGVEEKFYVVWPLLLLAVRRPGPRLAGAVLLLAFTWATQLLGWPQVPFYTAILAGCVVGLALHSRRGFELLAFARTPWFGVLALTVGVVAAAMATQGSFASRTNLAMGVAAALPMMVTAGGPLGAVLSARPLAALGDYTYTVYLMHPFAITGTDALIDYGQQDLAIQLVRLLVASALAFAVAAVLYRVVEKPLIRLGHRVTRRPTPPGAIDATGPVERPGAHRASTAGRAPRPD